MALLPALFGFGPLLSAAAASTTLTSNIGGQVKETLLLERTVSIISSSQSETTLGYLPFLIPVAVIGVVALVVLVAVNTMSKREARTKSRQFT